MVASTAPTGVGMVAVMIGNGDGRPDGVGVDYTSSILTVFLNTTKYEELVDS